MSIEKTKRNKKIIKMWGRGLTYAQLGILFGIHRQTAFDIINRDKKRKRRK